LLVVSLGRTPDIFRPYLGEVTAEVLAGSGGVVYCQRAKNLLR
jgi:hypothetical protein